MGLGFEGWLFTHRNLQTIVGDIKEKYVVELGNTLFHAGKQLGLPYKVTKEYYESQGCNHFYIDLNGKDGAYKIDMSKPITDQKWLDHFDILFNFTFVHTLLPIGNLDAHWECWKNMHDLVKPGGIFIHILHVPGCYIGLAKCYKVLYGANFVTSLAQTCGYKIHNVEVIPRRPEHGEWYDVIGHCVQKTDKPFMTDKNEFFKWLIRLV